MKGQSKSKTFPKGTAFVDLLNWMTDEAEATVSSGSDGEQLERTNTKVLITIVRYTSKEEKDEN